MDEFEMATADTIILSQALEDAVQKHVIMLPDSKTAVQFFPYDETHINSSAT